MTSRDAHPKPGRESMDAVSTAFAATTSGSGAAIGVVVNQCGYHIPIVRHPNVASIIGRKDLVSHTV